MHDITPVFVTEVSVPLDIRGSLLEDQLLACGFTLCKSLNHDITFDNKSETTFNLKMSQNHVGYEQKKYTTAADMAKAPYG